MLTLAHGGTGGADDRLRSLKVKLQSVHVEHTKVRKGLVDSKPDSILIVVVRYCHPAVQIPRMNPEVKMTGHVFTYAVRARTHKSYLLIHLFPCT
jgi:hypothetical protein